MRGQALAAVLLKGFGVGSAMLLQWLVARLYGPAGQGLFALMATTVTLTGVVAIFGQDYLALRNISGDLAEGKVALARAQARTSIRIAVTGSLFACLAVIGAALFYDRALDSPATMIILLAGMPACFALAIGRVYSFIARAGGSVFKSQLIDGPIPSGVGVVLVALLWLMPERPPIWWLGITYSIANLAGLALGYSIGKRTIAAWPRGDERVPARPLLIAGVSRVVGYASPFLTDWLIVFAMTALWGAAAAGLVRVPTLFINAMFLIAVAFDAVFAPKMAAALRLGDMSGLRRLYRNYALGSAGLNLPVVLALITVPELVLGIFGAEFTAGAEALRVAAVMQFITIAMGPAGLVLVMSHNEKLTYISNFSGLAVLGVMCWLVIPQYGVPGGILTFAAVQLGKRIVEFTLVKARLKVRLLV